MKNNENEEKLFFYGMYVRAIAGIKHFDSVQTYYRMLASQLLLGVFAICGFTFSSDMSFKFLNPSWVVFGACILGALVITALGFVDLIFQERLLIANFREAYDLEERFDWLPQIHHNMIWEGKHHASSARKSIFYISSNLTLFLLAALSLILAETQISHILISCSMYALFLFVYFKIFVKMVGKFDEIFDQIAPKVGI